MHRNGHQLISLTAYVHFGARLGAFFYWTGFFWKQCTIRQYANPIYLINLLWKLGLGLGWTQSCTILLAFFTEHLFFSEWHGRQPFAKTMHTHRIKITYSRNSYALIRQLAYHRNSVPISVASLRSVSPGAIWCYSFFASNLKRW